MEKEKCTLIPTGEIVDCYPTRKEPYAYTERHYTLFEKRYADVELPGENIFRHFMHKSAEELDTEEVIIRMQAARKLPQFEPQETTPLKSIIFEYIDKQEVKHELPREIFQNCIKEEAFICPECNDRNDELVCVSFYNDGTFSLFTFH